MGEFGIGQPVPREEDPYLVRGAGRYVDDVAPPGQARAYLLRSPHSHARIRTIDTARAKTLPGVVLVLAGNDPDVLALGLQQPWHPRKRRDGSRGFHLAATAARARTGALHRRSGGPDRGRDHRAGQGRRRGDRDRLRGVAGGDLGRGRGRGRARPPCGTPAATTRPSCTSSATRRRWSGRSRRRRMWCGIASSSAASPPTPWSRAAASPSMTRARTASRCAVPCRCRT